MSIRRPSLRSNVLSPGVGIFLALHALAAETDGIAPQASVTPATVPSSSSTPASITAKASDPTNAAATPQLVERKLPEIHGKISLPKDWTLLPGKLLEGDVLLAVREKITGENDPWTTGLSMTIDRNGARDSGMKAGEYALGIAREAHEKAGEEAGPISETRSGVFREIRFEFPVASEPPLQVTELLRANDKTGTVAVILWQSPKSEADSLRGLRDAVFSGIVLNPSE
jgi:hypothetical protein